jgi:hypothetical protein
MKRDVSVTIQLPSGYMQCIPYHARRYAKIDTVSYDFDRQKCSYEMKTQLDVACFSEESDGM